MNIGYFLSSEEWGPHDLIAQAINAQTAGFDSLWISDHYHPWNDEQGHSPFVWSTIGAIAQAAAGMKVTTAVTCPTIRIHPAVVAQAAATSAVMLDGNFCVGVGSGEALNEHILGDAWPDAAERLEMLEEAVEVMRMLWQGGAKDYRRPPLPGRACACLRPPGRAPADRRLGVRAEGDRARRPDRRRVLHGRPRRRCGEAVPRQRGRGQGRPGRSEGVLGRRRRPRAGDGASPVAERGSPRRTGQVLPTPEHFEQASRLRLVTEDMLAEDTPCGPDVERHVEAIKAYQQAGFDAPIAPTWFDYVYCVGAVGLALLIAALDLWARRIGVVARGVRRAASTCMIPIRRLHSGRVGDYTAALALGVGVLSALMTQTLR